MSSINASGTVAGYYQDPQGVAHGFVRMSDGTITSFDPKGAVFTEATGINDKGEIAGWYREEIQHVLQFRAGGRWVNHHYCNPTNGYEPSTVSLDYAKGNVTGWYTTGNEMAGFVGKPDGKIRQLSVEGIAINTKGAVTGTDGSDGFVRSAKGNTVTFKGPNNPYTTIPTSINNSGDVAGYAQTICGIAYKNYREVRAVTSPRSGPAIRITRGSWG